MTRSRTTVAILAALAAAAPAARAQQPTTTPPAPPTPAAAADTSGVRQYPANVRRVTLREALDLGRQFNPTMVQAEQNLRVADMSVTQAYGAFLPTLSSTAGTNRSSSPQFNAGQTTPRTDATSASLSANLQLFTGFQRGAKLRAANANRDVNQATVLQQQYATDLATKQAFFTELANEELVTVAQTQVRRSGEQLKLTSEKLRLGATTRADSLQAQVDYGTQQLALIQAQANARTAQANLGRAIGSAGLVVAVPDTTLEIRLASLDTAALRREAEATAPSVVQAQAGVVAAQASLTASRAVYFPTVSAGASERWTGNALAWANPNYKGIWSLSLSVSLPIFDGFQREANIVTADANTQTAQAKLRDARLLLDANLTQALAALDAAGQQIDVSRTQVAAAQENLRMQRERYRLGASTIVDMLTAEVSTNQAEVSLVQARYNYLIARAQLEAYVGHAL